MAKEKAARRINPLIYVLTAAVVVAVAIGGVKVGDWLSHRNAVETEGRRVDEYQGLGDRTGLTGEVTLLVKPMSLSVASGKKFNVSLTLTNKTNKTLFLNDWFTPEPAQFQSNQLPVKMIVRRSGRQVQFFGQPDLFPLHTRKDFMALEAGEARTFSLEVTTCGGSGRWDMAAPGSYAVEMWYETYLSGKYIGANAWNGMTNHVVVQVAVLPGVASVR